MNGGNARWIVGNEAIRDFIIALLSVNNYPLERTYDLRDRLQLFGLTDIVSLAEQTEDQIAELLRQAGYDRGEFLNSLMASRLSSVAKVISAAGRETATHVLHSGESTDITTMLQGAKGVGPIVIKNFLLLRKKPS
jgi:hypothetical protein